MSSGSSDHPNARLVAALTEAIKIACRLMVGGTAAQAAEAYAVEVAPHFIQAGFIPQEASDYNAYIWFEVAREGQ
jgi:hypothetical protein